MSEPGDKTNAALVKQEAKQRLNAEHLLERVLNRRRYTAKTRDELAEFLIGIEKGQAFRKRSTEKRTYVKRGSAA